MPSKAQTDEPRPEMEVTDMRQPTRR